MRPGGGTGGARGAGRGEVTAERGSSSGEVGLSRDFSGHGPAEGAENRHREGHPEVLCSSHSEGRGCSRPTAAVRVVRCHVWGVWHPKGEPGLGREPPGRQFLLTGAGQERGGSELGVRCQLVSAGGNTDGQQGTHTPGRDWSACLDAGGSRGSGGLSPGSSDWRSLEVTGGHRPRSSERPG